MEENRTVLRTYGNAWKFEKKIYAFGDITLPFPINVTQIGWMGLGLVIMYILVHILPFLQDAPGVITYILCPFGIMKLLTRVTFHGKPTVAWLRGFFKHLGNPVNLERCQTIAEDRSGVFTNITFKH